MIEDVKTMMWKELKELFMKQGSFKGGMFGLIMFAAIFGVYLPWTIGRDLVSSPVALLFWMWVPLLLVMAVVVDSFAGERERHTLETLLASRLSDRAILYGKILTAVIYGWGLTTSFVILGLITVT
jgi:ABC-2 type transport system permease protein